MSLKPVGEYALVITGAALSGVFSFVASFAVLDFLWTHLVIRNREASLGDGVVVVGGGLVIGVTFGLLAIVFVLYRFWPARRKA